MSTVPNSACGSELECGSELGVLGLGAPLSSHPATFLSTYSHSSSQPVERSDPQHSKASVSKKPGQRNGIASSDVVSRKRTAVHTVAPVSSEQVPSEQVPNAQGALGGLNNRNNHSKSNSPSDGKKRKLHRIAEVRKSQGLSERSICKRLSIDVQMLRVLEDPTRDLPLSELMQVQAALEVPLVDLLEDSNSLARPIQERAKLVRIMKTVAAIEESQLNLRPKRLVSMLREQLVELMPELAEVGSWPQFGSRRGSSSIARVLEQEINLSQIPSAE